MADIFFDLDFRLTFMGKQKQKLGYQFLTDSRTTRMENMLLLLGKELFDNIFMNTLIPSFHLSNVIL